MVKQFVSVTCPYCESSLVAHYQVDVFERAHEDSEEGLHVQVGRHIILTSRRMRGNPSRRRSGILAHFACESCNELFVVALAQHKGQTDIDIRTYTEKELEDLWSIIT